jgi:hypothetical protein
MMITRAEWEADREERNRRTGEWGFGPGMPWHVAKWRERSGIVLFYAIGWGVVFPVMLIGVFWLFGAMIDGVGRYNVEHDQCLKHATNGYEIRQCH